MSNKRGKITLKRVFSFLLIMVLINVNVSYASEVKSIRNGYALQEYDTGGDVDAYNENLNIDKMQTPSDETVSEGSLTGENTDAETPEDLDESLDQGAAEEPKEDGKDEQSGENEEDEQPSDENSDEEDLNKEPDNAEQENQPEEVQPEEEEPEQENLLVNASVNAYVIDGVLDLDNPALGIPETGTFETEIQGEVVIRGTRFGEGTVTSIKVLSDSNITLDGVKVGNDKIGKELNQNIQFMEFTGGSNQLHIMGTNIFENYNYSNSTKGGVVSVSNGANLSVDGYGTIKAGSFGCVIGVLDTSAGDISVRNVTFENYRNDQNERTMVIIGGLNNKAPQYPKEYPTQNINSVTVKDVRINYTSFVDTAIGTYGNVRIKNILVEDTNISTNGQLLSYGIGFGFSQYMEAPEIDRSSSVTVRNTSIEGQVLRGVSVYTNHYVERLNVENLKMNSTATTVAVIVGCDLFGGRVGEINVDGLDFSTTGKVSLGVGASSNRITGDIKVSNSIMRGNFTRTGIGVDQPGVSVQSIYVENTKIIGIDSDSYFVPIGAITSAYIYRDINVKDTVIETTGGMSVGIGAERAVIRGNILVDNVMISSLTSEMPVGIGIYQRQTSYGSLYNKIIVNGNVFIYNAANGFSCVNKAGELIPDGIFGDIVINSGNIQMVKDGQLFTYAENEPEERRQALFLKAPVNSFGEGIRFYSADPQTIIHEEITNPKNKDQVYFYDSDLFNKENFIQEDYHKHDYTIFTGSQSIYLPRRTLSHVSFLPKRFQANVPLDTTVSITFDTAVQPGNESAALTVYEMTDKGRIKVKSFTAKEVNILDRTISFPLNGLKKDALYSVVVDKDYLMGKIGYRNDYSGIALGDYVFTTIPSDNSGGVKPEPVFPDVYTVTFDSRGGSKVSPINDITANQLISEPKAPVKSGFTMVGWYKDIAGVNIWDFNSDKVTEDLTLYAVWKADASTTPPVDVEKEVPSNPAPKPEVIKPVLPPAPQPGDPEYSIDDNDTPLGGLEGDGSIDINNPGIPLGGAEGSSDELDDVPKTGVDHLGIYAYVLAGFLCLFIIGLITIIEYEKKRVCSKEE